MSLGRATCLLETRHVLDNETAVFRQEAVGGTIQYSLEPDK